MRRRLLVALLPLGVLVVGAPSNGPRVRILDPATWPAVPPPRPARVGPSPAPPTRPAPA